MSPLTRLYLAFSQVSGPIWRWKLRGRLKKGKERADRLPEKNATYATAPPGGEVIWFHALSVGESLALIPLIETALTTRPGVSVVLTTSTATSVAALDRADLPGGVQHVMLPMDTAAAVRRFLDHWRPKLAVFAELDFWPRLMIDTHRRGIPMVLVNSRMSERSFVTRGRLGGLMRDVLGLFDALLLQDEDSVGRFAGLGAPEDRIKVVGSLKAAARPLPANADDLADMRARLGARSVWLAAATHPVEEPGVLAAHIEVSKAAAGALLIIAPRYMDSADVIEAEAGTHFSNIRRRSRGEMPGAETEVYIADTIGEMGLWYRVAPVSFVGHSLAEADGSGGGGKNPYEALALGSAVVSGSDVADFSETYEFLWDRGAAFRVLRRDALAKAVADLMSADAREPQIVAGRQVIEDRRAVLADTWAVLEANLPGSD